MPFKKGNQLGKKNKGKKLSKEHKKKVSLTLKRKGIKPPSRKGIKDTDKTRLKKSKAQKLKIKNNTHNLWKGGKTKEAKIIRGGIEYRLWREAVFARDNWTCQKCKARCCELHPHHIKPFAKYPALRLAIDNGITLCRECHWEIHWGKHIDKDPKGWSVAGDGGPDEPFDKEEINYRNKKWFQEVSF